MSVTVEDKIELFRKMLINDIEINSSIKKKTMVEEYEKQKEQLKNQLEGEKKKIIEDSILKATKEKQQIIAKQYSEQQHAMLEKQQEYVIRTIELIREKACNFVCSSDYLEKYLRKTIKLVSKSFEDAEEIIFYFDKRDLETHGKFINNCLATTLKKRNYEMRTATGEIIGGFIVEDKQGAIQADYTLASLISENKDLIGISIAQMFNEVTD